MFDFFARTARFASWAIGHPIAFALACAGIVIWALAGPSAGYSENWQLIVNTGTTILTFLMLFLVQNAQNRDSRAMQLKLDELLRAVRGARNEMIDIENLTEAELERYASEFKDLHCHYRKALERRLERENERRADRS